MVDRLGTPRVVSKFHFCFFPQKNHALFNSPIFYFFFMTPTVNWKSAIQCIFCAVHVPPRWICPFNPSFRFFLFLNFISHRLQCTSQSLYVPRFEHFWQLTHLSFSPDALLGSRHLTLPKFGVFVAYRTPIYSFTMLGHMPQSLHFPHERMSVEMYSSQRTITIPTPLIFHMSLFCTSCFTNTILPFTVHYMFHELDLFFHVLWFLPAVLRRFFALARPFIMNFYNTALISVNVWHSTFMSVTLDIISARAPTFFGLIWNFFFGLTTTWISTVFF